MAPMATLLIEQIEGPVLQPEETVARLAYPFCYVGESDQHLMGQPCDVLPRGTKSIDAGSRVVAFACGCREVVPGWTLRPNAAGVQ